MSDIQARFEKEKTTVREQRHESERVMGEVESRQRKTKEREGGRKGGREEKKEGGSGAGVWWKAASVARCES